MLAQQCYICGLFFQDKVKLGVHIALCYTARGETWHPHPDILLGGAQKRKVAFATEDEFASLHAPLRSPNRGGPPTPALPAFVPTAELPPPQRHDPRGDVAAVPPPRAPPPAPPSPPGPSPRQGGAQRGQQLPWRQPPVAPRFATPGVNTLREELQDELRKVRDFMDDERRRATERDAALASLLTSAAHAVDHSQTVEGSPSRGALPSIASWWGSCGRIFLLAKARSVTRTRKDGSSLSSRRCLSCSTACCPTQRFAAASARPRDVSPQWSASG